MEHLGVLSRRDRRPAHCPLDHLDVEADLLLQGAELTLRGAAQALLRMADHRVVHAADEPGQADDALEVDLDDVEWWGVGAVGLGQLERQLVGERRLTGVPGPEQRDVGLTLERQRDLVGERIHPDDLRGVIERAVPDERVQHGRPSVRILPLEPVLICTALTVQKIEGHGT